MCFLTHEKHQAQSQEAAEKGIFLPCTQGTAPALISHQVHYGTVITHLECEG